VGAVSPNGVLGDPTGASPTTGARYLEAMARGVAGLIRAGRADSRGMLCRAAEVAP
jgi:mycofactocin precursor peptide peptidase